MFHLEGFFLGTFRTNSWELNFLRTKFFMTCFLELTGRLLICGWCLGSELSTKIQLYTYLIRLVIRWVNGLLEKIENFLFFMQTCHLRCISRSEVSKSHLGFKDRFLNQHTWVIN